MNPVGPVIYSCVMKLTTIVSIVLVVVQKVGFLFNVVNCKG
jgi:hypothetical protein